MNNAEAPHISRSEMTEIEQLRKKIDDLSDIVLNLQQQIVSVTAAHVDNLFSNQVMLDTIAHRLLVAAANALAHKARTSKERMPQLVVVEGYVPGAMRATIHEDGTVFIEEEVETDDPSGQVGYVSGDDLSDQLKDPAFAQAIGDLLLSYTATPGRAYYVIDDVSLEEFRQQAAERAKTAIAAGE